jgi:hypothetical protein
MAAFAAAYLVLRSRGEYNPVWVAHRNISQLFQREYWSTFRRSCVLTPRNSEAADLWRGRRDVSVSDSIAQTVPYKPDIASASS